MDTVFLLYREISDQYSKSEVVGVFSSKEKAERANVAIRQARYWIEEMKVDPWRGGH